MLSPSVAPPSVPALRPLHRGWRDLHPDVSLNFQLNRWLAYGGEAWLRDVEPVLPRLTTLDAWRDEFMRLGDAAERDGRWLDAALHLRAAEFFMLADDPRKQPARGRLLAHLRETYAASYTALEAPLGDVTLPIARFGEPRARGSLVVFGGFDSYIEEFFPILHELGALGHDVVAFEGPGQGSVLEDQRVAMSPDWHRPVAAVLDALGLDDVTLVGISLGGCLVIRAAAFEPRVRRVIAYDVLTSFEECMMRQVPELARPVMRGLLATHAGSLMDGLVDVAAAHRPVIEWGIRQAMRVFGAATPHEAWKAAHAYRSDDVSQLVTQDVLLLAGADDHYVPTGQLWTQAAALTRARSVTARLFTAEEQAQAHCQVGNLLLAIDVIARWIDATGS